MKAEDAKKLNPIVDRLAEEIDAFLEGYGQRTSLPILQTHQNRQ